MLLTREVTVFSAFLTITIVNALPSPIKEELIEDVPPPPKYVGIFDSKQNRDQIAEKLNQWKPEDDTNVWELSGLHEGDIMESETSDKNGLLDEDAKWIDAIVPYYINKSDFSKEQIKQIEDALETYHNKTCIRFRPYKKGDKDYVQVKGDSSGCWSYVGRHGGGQVLNFQNPGCLRHGTIVHEFMHALGFYHQQSAADRDEWVTIKWMNIMPGREHNFNKYTKNTVSDFGVGYDYGSVMHYSAKAFSRNGKETIVAKMQNITLGQRSGFSEKDIMKLNSMYKSECKARENKEKEEKDKEEKEENETAVNGAISMISSIWPFNTLSWFKKQ